MLRHSLTGSYQGSEMSHGMQRESRARQNVRTPKLKERKKKPTGLVFPCKGCIWLIMGGQLGLSHALGI